MSPRVIFSMPYHQVKCRILTSNSLKGDEEKKIIMTVFPHFSPLPLLILNKYYMKYCVSNRGKEGGTKHLFSIISWRERMMIVG